MLLSSKFDINSYMNQLFPDGNTYSIILIEDSLKNLDTHLQDFDENIVKLDLEIKACIRE